MLNVAQGLPAARKSTSSISTLTDLSDTPELTDHELIMIARSKSLRHKAQLTSITQERLMDDPFTDQPGAGTVQHGSRGLVTSRRRLEVSGDGSPALADKGRATKARRGRGAKRVAQETPHAQTPPKRRQPRSGSGRSSGRRGRGDGTPSAGSRKSGDCSPEVLDRIVVANRGTTLCANPTAQHKRLAVRTG